MTTAAKLRMPANACVDQPDTSMRPPPSRPALDSRRIDDTPGPWDEPPMASVDTKPADPSDNSSRPSGFRNVPTGPKVPKSVPIGPRASWSRDPSPAQSSASLQAANLQRQSVSNGQRPDEPKLVDSRSKGQDDKTSPWERNDRLSASRDSKQPPVAPKALVTESRQSTAFGVGTSQLGEFLATDFRSMTYSDCNIGRQNGSWDIGTTTRAPPSGPAA